MIVNIIGSTADFQEDAEHAFICIQATKQIEKKIKPLQEYMCAFVNTNGGTIHIGIKSGGLIRGTLCDRNVMDRIRLMVDQSVFFAMIIV